MAGGLYHHSFFGAVLGFVWGGVARIFFVHHVTWSVNSFGHIFGDQAFRTHDQSRNNLFLALRAWATDGTITITPFPVRPGTA